jgi:hypothetical protein
MKAVKIALAWLLVAIPLAWGVTKSVQKSLPLFARGNDAIGRTAK